jgi:hypothetical protein
MSAQPFKKSCIDCHIHLSNIAGIDFIENYRQQMNLEATCIQALPSRRIITGNPTAFAAKAHHPETFYVFGALNHVHYFSNGEINAPALAQQVDMLRETGADGIKMLENKPTTRKILDIPVDSDYFDPFFARMEACQFPLLWHVADPETFWDPQTLPAWAKERGWGYDDSHVAKEKLYAEVENVLQRYPRLRIIFAHFYFLSADLPRAARLLDRYSGVSLDLTPGIELLYNLSVNTDATRDFFIKYADRILFGTDVADSLTLEESILRCDLLKRWLDSDETYRVPAGADMLLGPPEDGLIRGLALPEEVLAAILRDNFVKLIGEKPAPLNRAAAIQECKENIAANEKLNGAEAAVSARKALQSIEAR